MTYKPEYLSTFRADVLSASLYMADYPKKAARIFAELDKNLSLLTEMPEMYPVYRDLPKFRFFAVEDYLVFYKVREPDKIVEIHRLIYGRMDISAALK